ncbi:MAG: CDP-diacylglycerol--glycerol-3-phosphate 3-phosphatidyltransferase [Candidatus Babeliales bacterium]
MQKNTILSLPLTLTGIRLIIAPLLLPFLVVYLLPLNLLWLNCLIGVLFFAFGLTDFFDGYYARKNNQVTLLGALLDPIADKFLNLSTLLGLLVVHKISFFWVMLFIARELFVMSLRLIAAEHGKSISVSWHGKLKTTAQFVYITVAICNPLASSYTTFTRIEEILLCIAVVSTLLSAYAYYRSFIAIFPDILYRKSHDTTL